MSSLRGEVIEESLSDRAALDGLTIVSTRVEPVTEKHKTPWLKQWTLHTVRVSPEAADAVAQRFSKSLADHYWYVDFKNIDTHYIVFPNKVFVVDRENTAQYKPVIDHGLTLGIPRHQLDFAPQIKYWKRIKE